MSAPDRPDDRACDPVEPYAVDVPPRGRRWYCSVTWVQGCRARVELHDHAGAWVFTDAVFTARGLVVQPHPDQDDPAALAAAATPATVAQTRALLRDVLADEECAGLTGEPSSSLLRAYCLPRVEERAVALALIARGHAHEHADLEAAIAAAVQAPPTGDC